MMSWLPRLLMIAGMALFAGYWFWRLTGAAAPDAFADPSETEPRHLAAQLASAHLFGVRHERLAGSIQAEEQEFRLIGVAAGSGIALIANLDKPAGAYRVGAEIVPETRLVTVAARHVELERAGARAILKLPAERGKKTP